MNQQTVSIDRVREIARLRLELQTRLLEMRHRWLLRSERIAREARIGGPLPSSGVTIVHSTVDEQEQERATALCALTENHAADVWEAIYQQSYPGHTPEPDDAAGPADETSVGPERGSARPCSPAREAPQGGPVSEASERGAADMTPPDVDLWGVKPDCICREDWTMLCALARLAFRSGAPLAETQRHLAAVIEDVRASGAIEPPDTITIPRREFVRLVECEAELALRSEPTTRPAPPPVHVESELDELLCESGISPPELVRRVTDRLGHAGLLDRVVAGDLLNDDQAITLVVVMAQELMASIAHLRPVEVKLHYLLELRGIRGA